MGDQGQDSIIELAGFAQNCFKNRIKIIQKS